MHLEKPYLTTTRYTIKGKKNNSKKLQAAKASHEAWLKKQGLDDESLAKKLPKNKKGKRVGIHDIPDYSTGPSKTSDKVAGHGAAREQKQYTGTYITGICTMHKSNAVPVSNQQQAIDIANMRRS